MRYQVAHRLKALQWRRQLPRNGGGAKGAGGLEVEPPEKFLGPCPFYVRKHPFYRQKMPMLTAGGTPFNCKSTLRSSKTVKILGFLMTNVANKAVC